MKVFEYLDRISLMHKLVSRQKTGTPEEFARQLGVSRTSLYELIDELRNELSRTRGKLHDIKRSFGWNEWVENYEGGLTCMISAMSNFQDELKRFEDKHCAVAEKV